MGPLRIGHEFVDADDVPAEKVDFLRDNVMAHAVSFWSSALRVHQAAQPLRVPRGGPGCWIYSGDTFCTSSTAPTCGFGGVVTVPDRLLRSSRTCSTICSPRYSCTGACYVNSQCQCNVEDWAAQGDSYCCTVVASQDSDCYCTGSELHFAGSGLSGQVVCGNCTEEPEGEGAVDEDMHVFVTAKQRSGCGEDTYLQASATWCVKDQCDRPVFAHINFCPSKVDPEGDVAGQISTAIHELAHALGFSSSLFKYFRHPDGSPRIPRVPGDPDAFPGAFRWSCSGGAVTWPDPGGDWLHVDLAPAILEAFSERGYNDCQCPIGNDTLGSGCLLSSGPPGAWRVPSCVVRVTTPAVLAEARAHFGCDSLGGAELENQPTGECSVVGSHWEHRVFNGEVMAPVSGSGTGVPTYLSRVTLALFQDSGWYEADMAQADRLTAGVHWGYQRGCGFATQRCISDAGLPVWDRAFCTAPGQATCSLDRTRTVMCSVGTVGEGSTVPAAFDYLGGNVVGTHAEMDYCPSYLSGATNRICTDQATSDFAPYHDVNFMREVFGGGGRCLTSTLRADVPAQGGGVHRAEPDDLFTAGTPCCYEVACSEGGASYDVKIADLSVAGGLLTLGTCTAAGAVLETAGMQGGVTCAAPAELCQALPAAHNAQSTGTLTTVTATTTSATATTVTATATTVTVAENTATATTTQTATTSATATETRSATPTETETTSTTATADAAYLNRCEQPRPGPFTVPAALAAALLLARGRA